MNSIVLLHAISLVAYLGAGASVAVSLAAGQRTAPRFGVVLIGVAVVAQAIGLALYTARYHELPLVGLAASLSTLAFLIGAALFGATLLRAVRPVALVLIPLIAVLLAISLTLGLVPGGAPSQFRGIWFAAHVMLAFAAYSSLALAFAAGLLYLLQFRALKGKNFGRAFRFFPPLETLDRLRQGALWTGLPTLTFALLLGWAWTVRFHNSFAPQNPQVIWGVVTWFVFIAALAARRGAGGAERRAATVAVAGFAVVVVTYMLLRILMPDGRSFL
jgi:HemX protein